ncbi:deoxygluconate dehydrogenase [Xenorhabdus szentirmaii]|nr:deoxygluconate dehydrogenase [Xenorhabdus szentirmaii DSM 16338]PHM42210.1 deoxygluconate dehydrogenase [Xenorhabdus szentirmaii]
MMFNKISELSQLKGKRVVVTGGGRDFGQAVPFF